jgi:hypothetical protein
VQVLPKPRLERLQAKYRTAEQADEPGPLQAGQSGYAFAHQNRFSAMVLSRYLYGLDLGRGEFILKDGEAVAVRYPELVEPTRDKERVAWLSELC